MKCSLFYLASGTSLRCALLHSLSLNVLFLSEFVVGKLCSLHYAKAVHQLVALLVQGESRLALVESVIGAVLPALKYIFN